MSHAQDCAQYLGATLEAIDINDFLSDAAKYLEKNKHIVTLMETVDIGPVFLCAHRYGARVGLLPATPKSRIRRLYKILSTMEDAMPLALHREKGTSMDLLICNNEVVTWMVTLGDVPFIELRQIAYQQNLLWEHLKAIPDSFKALFRMQTEIMTVTTEDDTKIKTALVGAMVIENDIESLVSHFAGEPASPLDSSVSAVLVAPTSIMGYLGFLTTFLSPKPRPSRAIGYIKSARMSLESNKDIDYYIDGQQRQARSLEFHILPKAVTIKTGQKFVESQKVSEKEDEILKIQTLPQGEERLAPLLQQRLPLFSSAKEEDFKETFTLLRSYSRLSAPFILLMALSSMLATLGLFLNNAPVVIGAMLLAPLMGPLVSLAMGILRNDEKLLKSALKVLAIGTGLTLMVAAMTTLLIPFEQVTNEIRARLQPNILDLGVAVVSGFAAAYAHARENIQKSLPGVAVAVALVPPACVMGIGLGWMDWQVISGAGLLFATNLVGIALAGMFAFLILGFTPFIKVNRELGFSLLLAALISIPLYQTFKNTVVYERIGKNISIQSYSVNGKIMELSDVSIFPENNKIKVSAQLHSSETVQTNDIAALRDLIQDQLDDPVVLDVSIRLMQ